MVYSHDDVPLWDSGTAGQRGDHLTLRDDGSLALFTGAGVPVWQAAGDLGSGAGCSRSLVAAGDMNSLPDTLATGALAQAQHPDLIATLGDHVYPAATLADLQARYAPTPWGQMRALDHPVPGHHEYQVPGAAGYFAFFGVADHYAYDIGCGWRGYALNSLGDVASQAQWLSADLAANPGVPVVATWSDPPFSTGTEHGGEPAMQPFVDALAGRTAIVLSGHEHDYERFAPVDGVRPFVVRTGGSASYLFGQPKPGSQSRITGVPGVLVLSPGDAGIYSWAFKDTRGAVLDSGTG